MPQSARNSYLETQVLTATPQKLRLMLIEGAIRFARRAQSAWDDNRNEALESLRRCRSIVSELLAAVQPDESELPRLVAGVYVFLFQALTVAQSTGDRRKLDDVLRILDIERETWRQLCNELPDSPAASRESQSEVTAAGEPAISLDPTSEHTSSSISLDA